MNRPDLPLTRYIRCFWTFDWSFQFKSFLVDMTKGLVISTFQEYICSPMERVWRLSDCWGRRKGTPDFLQKIVIVRGNRITCILIGCI